MEKKNIWSRILSAGIAMSLAVTFTVTGSIFTSRAVSSADLPVTTISEVYIPSETITETEKESKEEAVIEESMNILLEPMVVERVRTTDLDILLQEMEKCKSRKEQAHKMAEAARALGYAEDHTVIVLAGNEWKNADENYNFYYNIYKPLKDKEDARLAEEARIAEEVRRAEEARKAEEARLAEEARKAEENRKLQEQQMGEYPAATFVWNYMKSLGWSDAACAGIMGNMMAEVGGQTLNLQYALYDSTGLYYGICQWHVRYFGQIHGASLEAQCKFLRDTIEGQFNTFSHLYSNDMNYETFIQMTDPAAAALCFAKVYERCGSAYYAVRQSNAQIAYNYFVN